MDQEQTDGSGGLIEKWVAPNVPPIPDKYVIIERDILFIEYNFFRSKRVKVVEYSFAQCEGLNTLGRFSYNKFNKEIEVRQLTLHYEGSIGILLFCLCRGCPDFWQAKTSLQAKTARWRKAPSLHKRWPRGIKVGVPALSLIN